MNLKETILDVLITLETSRDNDNILIHKVLSNLGFKTTTETLWEYLRRVDNKMLPSFDTITRLGRLIKKESPHLRGKEYILRQTKKQEKALSDMNYIQKTPLHPNERHVLKS